MSEIYLDHNATSPLAPEVLEAMQPFLQGGYGRGGFGNASCAHRLGREARVAIDGVRRAFSEFFGCLPSECVCFRQNGMIL